MRIGGFSKLTTVDYPGELACGIFLVGCNFKCGYCHNPSLINGKDMDSFIPKEEVMEYLVERKDMLDGVCISGGEPTCNPELKDFIKEIKALGYKVKLDTNGTHPEIIEELLKENLLDYIAMDLKASPKKYEEVVGCKVNMDKIYKTIDIIKASGVKHEFRTTYLPMLDTSDIKEIATTMVKKNSKYFLQQFRNQVTNDIAYHNLVPHQKDYILNTAGAIQQSIGMCSVRGI